MSRYVNLNGVSWDGKPISSKIQEVQTEQGYQLGITLDWLWGDNVPHIDLEEHDKQIRADAIEEFVEKVCEKYTEEESKGNYKQYCGEIKQNIADIAEQLKAKEQNK